MRARERIRTKIDNFFFNSVKIVLNWGKSFHIPRFFTTFAPRNRGNDFQDKKLIKQLSRVMDKESVIKLLKEYKKKGHKVALLEVNIASQGVDVYKNEKMRVGLNNSTPLKANYGQEYCACNTIEEFEEGVVYGYAASRAAYTKYYVSDFISVGVSRKI